MSSSDNPDQPSSQPKQDDAEVEATTEYFEYNIVGGNYVASPVQFSDTGRYTSTGTSSTLGNLLRSTLNSGETVSRVQEAILNSQAPIPVNESSTKTVRINGIDITGVWVNRDECMNWRGPIPLDQYKINTESATIV